MIKVERFIIEYANSRIRQFMELKKEYPHQAEDYDRMINTCDKAVWMRKYGYCTADEAVRMILEAR